MTPPSPARGFLYPTTLKAKCPRYSGCLVTNKCQNYDRHCRLCALCEQRVRPAVHLGGCLPEGELVDDVQLAIKIIRDALNKPYAHPDAEQTSGGVEMRDVQKLEESSRILGAWNGVMGEQNVDVQVTQDQLAQVQGMM